MILQPCHLLTQIRGRIVVSGQVECAMSGQSKDFIVQTDTELGRLFAGAIQADVDLPFHGIGLDRKRDDIRVVVMPQVFAVHATQRRIVDKDNRHHPAGNPLSSQHTPDDRRDDIPGKPCARMRIEYRDCVTRCGHTLRP